ncbi:MAG: cobalamin-dependent protein [Heliobacteriaceae bacterium]|nr:cobalamin-dependent protein [Heliobacteriaceae bacterium]
MKQFKTVLIGLYNSKALGVRQLAAVLKEHGYPVSIIFFKDFNSLNAHSPTEREYDLLLDRLRELQPDCIGLSVMSSLYLAAAQELSRRLRAAFPAVPLVWGGVYATLFPQESAAYCDYLMRGECDEAIVDLVNTLALAAASPDGTPEPAALARVPNLCYRQAGELICNDLNPLQTDLDGLPFPDMGGDDKYHITNGQLTNGDPQLSSISYEMSASRGCPFVCSYCSSLNLKRLYRGKGSFVRLRSVASTLAELQRAKQKMKNLRMIWFWDEIFADDEDWVREFTREYRKKIGLPFNIWGHPLKINKRVMDMLVEAGLHQVVVGIQHGSPRIRKEIYFRRETDAQILAMSRILAAAKVPEVIYDLILDSPFETVADLEATYLLCRQLKKPFQLQLHGLHFLPGTDIEKIALEQGVLTRQDLQRLHDRPIEEQYRSFLWWTHTGSKEDRTRAYWKNMIYLTQFNWATPLLPIFKAGFFQTRPGTMNLLRTTGNGWNLFRRVSRKAILRLKPGR